MAWTTYEGKLTPTKRWAEAVEDFSDDKVQEHLFIALQELSSGKASLEKIENEIWIQFSYGWIRISKEGVIELGEGAA